MKCCFRKKKKKKKKGVLLKKLGFVHQPFSKQTNKQANWEE
jgi:hypothetical protein